MDKFIINGPCELSGDVTIGGFKNAAVAVLPATIIQAGVYELDNIPNVLSTVRTKLDDVRGAIPSAVSSVRSKIGDVRDDLPDVIGSVRSKVDDIRDTLKK